MLIKQNLLNRTQNKIKALTSKIAFFKGLFKEAIAKGLPHLWDGHGYIYIYIYIKEGRVPRALDSKEK